MDSSLAIADVPDRSRYEATLEGEVVGVLQYQRKDGLISFDHAETAIPFRGRGIAGRIVETALIAARADGLKVVPRCPYVADWIAAHAEYQPLVAS
jgi:predicted GNAT family acetyltransferase